MYHKLAGMTGTAKTEETEFMGIYNLDVVEIPTNKPVKRVDYNDVVCIKQQEKYNAIIEEIIRAHATGQPILVGTVSVEKSEYLSRLLTKRGIRHEVLNAKQHAKRRILLRRQVSSAMLQLQRTWRAAARIFFWEETRNTSQSAKCAAKVMTMI